jgi:guanylate kinase
MILTLSGISGVGKTTMATRLALENNFIKSVSYTTRAPRQGEQHEQDYVFVDKSTFEELLNQKFFLEHTIKFNNYYGTAYSNVENAINANKNIVLCLDENGVIQARERWKNLVTSIYLLPPSFDELSKRISARNPERIEELKKEFDGYLTHKHIYDHELEHDAIEKTYQTIVQYIHNTRIIC